MVKVTYNFYSELGGYSWKFTKPVTVEAQHCTNFSNFSQLGLFAQIAPRSPFHTSLRSMMESPLLVTVNMEHYLPLTFISGYRIAKEVTPGEHSCQYCAQVKHLQDYWYCHFVITKDLEMSHSMNIQRTQNFVMCLYFR